MDSSPQPNESGDPNKNGSAITSLVLGIVGIVLAFEPFFGIPCGVIGLIMGIKGKKSQKVGMANAGFIMSIVALGLSAIAFLTVSDSYYYWY